MKALNVSSSASMRARTRSVTSTGETWRMRIFSAMVSSGRSHRSSRRGSVTAGCRPAIEAKLPRGLGARVGNRIEMAELGEVLLRLRCERGRAVAGEAHPNRRGHATEQLGTYGI